MTIKLSSVKADTKRESEGAWESVPDLPGVRLKVRGFSYGPFQAARTIVEQRFARKYGRDPVPVNELIKENGKLYAEHILLGWEGFDVEYTREVAAETLGDPEYRDLHDHIRYCAGRVGTTQVEFVKEEIKNSAAPSATT